MLGKVPTRFPSAKRARLCVLRAKGKLLCQVNLAHGGTHEQAALMYLKTFALKNAFVFSIEWVNFSELDKV